jgi:hypothetical protein
MPVLLASLPDSDLPPVGECWQVIFKLINLALAVLFRFVHYFKGFA